MSFVLRFFGNNNLSIFEFFHFFYFFLPHSHSSFLSLLLPFLNTSTYPHLVLSLFSLRWNQTKRGSARPGSASRLDEHDSASHDQGIGGLQLPLMEGETATGAVVMCTWTAPSVTQHYHRSCRCFPLHQR